MNQKPNGEIGHRTVEVVETACFWWLGRYGRWPRTSSQDRPRVPWPRRHGHSDRCERLIADRPELKSSSQRNGQAHARRNFDDLFSTFLLAPHLASAGQEVPDLLDRPVLDGPGDVPRRELEVGHAPSGKPEQHANIGPIRSDAGTLPR